MNKEVNGTLIWYYYICHRETWLMGHSITPEDNDYIVLGRHIHEVFYNRERKEILIDNTIKIDLLQVQNGITIAEVKKSTKSIDAAKMQLAFYLYYFKKEKDIHLKGQLLIPTERKKIDVELTPELEKIVEQTIEEIKRILSLPKPPKPTRISYCKNCGYKIMCWL